MSGRTSKHGILLLVDADGESAKSARAVLQQSGFEVLYAHDDRAAWRILDALPASRRPGLILIDCVLPAMSGFELVRRIVDRFPNWRMPIFVMSKYPSTEDRVEATNAGAQGILSKPLSTGRLFELIEAHRMRILRLEIGGIVVDQGLE